jgi:hypothetical protein
MFNPQRLLQRYLRRIKSALTKKAAGVQPRRLTSESRTPAKKLPKTILAALNNAQDNSQVNSIHHKNQVIKTDRRFTHPDIVAFYLKLSAELGARGMPYYAHCFFRSGHEQNKLKAAGVSNAYAGQSAHQYGCAVDIVHSFDHWDRPEKEWMIIGTIGLEVARKMNLKVVWGGDWDGDGDFYDNRLFDPAHWELKNWRDYKRGHDQHGVVMTDADWLPD